VKKPEKLKEKFELILKEEAKDFSLVYIESGGGLALFERKELWLDMSFGLGGFLHELAHVTTKEGHTGIFADEFSRLVNKYCDFKGELSYE